MGNGAEHLALELVRAAERVRCAASRGSPRQFRRALRTRAARAGVRLRSAPTKSRCRRRARRPRKARSSSRSISEDTCRHRAATTMPWPLAVRMWRVEGRLSEIVRPRSAPAHRLRISASGAGCRCRHGRRSGRAGERLARCPVSPVAARPGCPAVASEERCSCWARTPSASRAGPVLEEESRRRR